MDAPLIILRFAASSSAATCALRVGLSEKMMADAGLPSLTMVIADEMVVVMKMDKDEIRKIRMLFIMLDGFRDSRRSLYGKSSTVDFELVHNSVQGEIVAADFQPVVQIPALSSDRLHRSQLPSM